MTTDKKDSNNDIQIDEKESSTQATWINEEIAEEDPMLTLISEATQLYVKKILETAVTMSRKKQNLDAKRLWHLHHVHHKKPPLGLVLGCDVYRQYAANNAEASNACLRLEQALARKNFGKDEDSKRINGDDGLIMECSSLNDLSRFVQQPNAVAEAEVFVKRKQDEATGTNTGDARLRNPPFGRVPKKCKLLTSDLVSAYRTMGMCKTSFL